MSRQAAINNIAKLLDKLEPSVRDAFLAAVFSARDAVDLRALEAALRAGDVAKAVNLLTLPQGVLFPLDAALVAGYADGGLMVVEAARRSGVIMGFDGRADRAEAWARNHVGGLITGIIDDHREMVTVAVRDVIERQLVQGLGPRSAALDLVGRINKATGRREGGILGLDGPRAERLRKIAEAMRTPEGVQSLVRGGAVRYKVNRATERRILRAWKEGKALSAPDRNLSLRQYGNKLLLERGETIARTEAITALRQGRREGFLQAIEQGHIPEDGIEREWDATMDKRTRDDHDAMDGQKVKGMAEPWVLPDGSRMMVPGDASMGAEADQIINCRCFEVVRVDWIANA